MGCGGLGEDVDEAVDVGVGLLDDGVRGEGVGERFVGEADDA